MTKVVVAERVPARARELLAHYELELVVDESQLPASLAGAAGLLSLLHWRIDDALLARAPSLRVVANYAVGFDNIDVAACTRHRVVATNTPDVVTVATADLTWALVLALSRRVVEADQFLRRGDWGRVPHAALRGFDLCGKTLGVVGMGRIGRAVARRAEAFDMQVIYSGPRAASDVPYARVPLDELLTQSDIVSLHCPLRADTRHLIGARELGRLKPGALLINTARGAVCDEVALAAWVKAGGIAGLDVFEHEPAVHEDLLASRRCVLVPHVGTETCETRVAMAELAARGIDDVLSGRRPAAPLNPEVLA
jgi:glyoxylate reductase